MADQHQRTDDDPTPRPLATKLSALLDLETIGDDRFVARNGQRRGVGDSVFGGQLLAQALRAATLTVPADRRPHSLHAHFVRPARRSGPVELEVTRVRDGGTLSIRQVVVGQNGDTCLLATASFKHPEDGAHLDEIPAGDPPPPPDACEVVSWDDLLETRAISWYRPSPKVALCDRFWVRSAHPLGSDPMVQLCALAYLSDLGSGFATLDEPNIPAGGPSLDHALWFHEPVRVDDWLLIDHRPLRVSDGRGTYLGSIRAVDGTLAAALTQEVLLRMPSPFARRPTGDWAGTERELSRD